MHPTALIELIHSVKRRIKQGDCPTEAPHSRETLEEMVVDLWELWQRERTRRKIASDPDDEPTAGKPGVNSDMMEGSVQRQGRLVNHDTGPNLSAGTRVGGESQGASGLESCYELGPAPECRGGYRAWTRTFNTEGKP